MESQQTIRLLAWEPLPIRKSGFEIDSRKEGKTLPNSVTEDISGFSLMPYYSVKQLRRIDRKQNHKNRDLAKSAKKEWRLNQKW